MYAAKVPRIRGRMAELGYSITSLADQIGVSRSTLSGYLNNFGTTPFSVVLRIAAILYAGDEKALIDVFFNPDIT